MGAGETGRASVDPFGSHFMNPATLVGTHDYNLGAAYSVNRPDGNNPVVSNAFLISDNSPASLVSAAAAYVYKRSSFDSQTLIDQDFSMSFAFRFLKRLSVGALGHRLVRQNNVGPGWAKHNMTLGVWFAPLPIWNLGVVGYDVLTDDDLDMLPVLALGSEISVMGLLKIKTDILRQEKRNPEKKINLNAGIEFDLGEGFNLRTGGIWDTLNNNTYWTLGLGWAGPRLSAGYAYKNNVNISKEITHLFQLWLSF
jgi:hypothetical protein